MKKPNLSIKKYIQNIFDVLNNTQVTDCLNKKLQLNVATDQIVNYIIQTKKSKANVIFWSG